MIATAPTPLRRLLAARLKSPEGWARVAAKVQAAIDTLSEGINSGALSVDVWQREMADVLMAGGLASYAEGRGIKPSALTPREQARAIEYLQGQLDYLNRFADEVEAGGWLPGMDARARMYGRAMRALYERGKTRLLDLPAMPGDGSTECLTNCKCNWELRWLDEEELDVDCYWVMGQAEHCPTCQERARKWRPLRVRGGEVVA